MIVFLSELRIEVAAHLLHRSIVYPWQANKRPLNFKVMHDGDAKE